MEVWRVLKRIAGLSRVKDICPNNGGPSLGHNYCKKPWEKDFVVRPARLELAAF